MKKLLLILLCLPLLFNSCKKEDEEPINIGNNNNGQTYVPDDNFEQKLIDLGLDNTLDNYVNTSSIDTLKFLSIPAEPEWTGDFNNPFNYLMPINDLTGLEDFISLKYLDCSNNPITSLNQIESLTQLESLSCRNTDITYLNLFDNINLWQVQCSYSPIESINTSGAVNLESLLCYETPLKSLNLSENVELEILDCYNTTLIELDLSNNSQLTYLQMFNGNPLPTYSNGTELTNLNLKNGNNHNLTHLRLSSGAILGNINLNCIQVDNNSPYFHPDSSHCFEPHHYLSEFCP